jgi:hypothetical protein
MPSWLAELTSAIAESRSSNSMGLRPALNLTECHHPIGV